MTRILLCITLLACRTAPTPVAQGCVLSTRQAAAYVGGREGFVPSNADVAELQAGLGNFDGGDCYFEVDFDLESHRYRDLHIHGYA